MMFFRRFLIVALCLLGAQQVGAWTHGTASGGGGACASGPLDTFTASPGAWTFAASLRVLKASYASGGGKAVQIQTSNGGATQDIGFSGCNPDVTSSASLCGAPTSLSAGTTTSARAAFPSGSVIHIFNTGPNDVFYAAGNGSVTATPTSTALPFNQGASITVGANTNLAAIIGNGYGLNGTAGSATILMTNCGVSVAYEQSGSGAANATQSTLAKQLGYFPSCTQGGFSCMVGCLTCNLNVADNAVYKTSTVETFTVMTWGEDTTSANFNYAGVIYPTTTSADASNTRWGLVNNGLPDIMANNLNGNNGNNAEGFGGVWRKQKLSQYDYSSGGITRWNGGTQFLNTGGGTPTYPNAVGLYLMGDAAGNGTPGLFVETLVASGTQTSRNSISANQVSYWSITAGTATQVALTNPLSDGWNFNAQQLGGFAPNPPGPGTLTINGNLFNSEGSWNNYSSWQATNGATTSGQLGDMYRFQITGLFDQWQGTFRSELDSGGTTSQINMGVDFWLAYAVLIEPGTAYNSAWNITGQMHDVAGPVCCIFNVESNTNSGVTDTFFIETFNATTGAQTSTSTGIPFSRNRYYNFVIHCLPSTSGSSDTFDVWVDAVTPGTMVHEVTLTGSLFGGNSVNGANYWKLGIYRETGASLPTFAVRYGNVQVCTTGAGCTAKYGTTDLSAQTTTPLANPAHLFLLKRDLDPASNDNTPMWLNKAA